MSATASSPPWTPDDVASRPLAAVASPDRTAPVVPGRLADKALTARIARYARCADSGLDPDQWFPVSIDPHKARAEAAAAIAVCAGCPVRGDCLELSLRRWDIGRHGVWGGLVAADRARLLPHRPAARARPARYPGSGG